MKTLRNKVSLRIIPNYKLHTEIKLSCLIISDRVINYD